MGIAKKAAATVVTTVTSMAWKRLGWPARAALMGGSFALGTARKLNGVRHRLKGDQPAKNGRRKMSTSPQFLPAAAAACLAQQQTSSSYMYREAAMR
ncbi:hypothetical protein D9Q98_008740 [Chlorella vulgaris]|uniref:Uncharacterized protein n=1 Tax=Chlorella vulgaris TaxID=3077 RepID=A0A9D4TIK8_CHLVU|nr:hypothetical protein D9Q98_008740 [Chlorella vulgaris]